jgi:hypothetical protein
LYSTGFSTKAAVAVMIEADAAAIRERMRVFMVPWMKARVGGLSNGESVSMRKGWGMNQTLPRALILDREKRETTRNLNSRGNQGIPKA